MENEKTQKEQVEGLDNVIKNAFDNTQDKKEKEKENESVDKENIQKESEQEQKEGGEEENEKNKNEDEEKDKKNEQEQKEGLLVSEKEYDFIPSKFKVLVGDKLDLSKTIAKIAKSYVHLESYASRKNSENEKLKKILNEIKEKRGKEEEELSEKEMEELIDDPKGFLKKYKEKILKQKEMFKEEQEPQNNDLIDRVNLWLVNNDVDDETKEEMGKLYSGMEEPDKIKWASLPIEDLLEHLKLKVENKKLKTGDRYVPKKPAIDDTKNVAPTAKSKANLNGMAYFIGKEFGLSEEEVKKLGIKK